MKRDNNELEQIYRNIYKTKKKKGNAYEKHSKYNKINTNLNSRKLFMKFLNYMANKLF